MRVVHEELVGKKFAGPKMISPSEVRYITDGIRQGIRSDGRSPDAIRKFDLDMGVIPTANGSCRIRSKGCDIYCGVKCEIGIPSPDRPEQGIVRVMTEFGCTVLPRTQDLTGRQANMEAESFGEQISRQIQSTCLTTLDMNQFCIRKGLACWILSIDVLVERIDGPLIDPISIAVRAALMDLELPVVAVPDVEKSAEDAPDALPRVDLLGSLWRVNVNTSVCISVGVFCDNSMIIVDLDRVEEWLARHPGNCLVSVSVDQEGTCSGIQKQGVGSVDPNILQNVISAALAVGKSVASAMTHSRQ
jgi:exosome complex RNA-binding protein Rrp42 (RNase PH superfamily)